MATVATFRWEIPPSAQLIPRTADYAKRIQQGLYQIGDLFAARMEAMARSTAPWNDQTGAARAGLVGTSVKSGTGVVIYLIHSMDYGIFLELGTRNMAARPVILPTLEANYGPVMSAARALVGQ